MNMRCLVLLQSLGTSFLVVLGAVQENPPQNNEQRAFLPQRAYNLGDNRVEKDSEA